MLRILKLITTQMSSRMTRHRPNGVAYPDWVRSRVLDSSPHESTRDIADRLGLSQSTVVRVLATEGNVGTRSGPRIATMRLGPEDAAFLCLLKLTYPQASLSECAMALESECGKIVSLATISREIRRLGMTRKKMQHYSTKRDENMRVAWWTRPPHMGGCAGVDRTNIIDIDESNVNIGDVKRRYGHAFEGQPARFASLVSTFFFVTFVLN